MKNATINSLAFWRMLCYGTINIPLSFIGYPLVIFVAPFYAGEMGLPLGLVGTMLFLARISDVVTDPLVGIGSDHLRTRWGRRKPVIAVGIVVMMIGIYHLFIPTPPVTVWYLMLWVSVVYLGFTMISIPHEAWGGELSSSYHERTRITGTRQFFGIVGLVAATVIPAMVLSRPDAKSGDVLATLGWVVIVLLPLIGALLLWAVPNVKVQPSHGAPTSWRRGLRTMMKNGPFVRVLLVLLLAVIGETFRITITLFFARDVVGIANVGSLYLLYFGVGLIGVPVWIRIGNTIGKHRALGFSFLTLAILSLAMLTLSKGDTTLFTCLFVAKGFCFGSLQMLPSAMIADIVDIDTLRSGKARQGLFYATGGAALKLGMALGQGLSLNALDLVNYQAKGGNDSQTIWWLSIFYCIPAAISFLVALPLVWKYPLTAERHKRIRAKIDARQTSANGPSPTQSAA